MEKYECEITEIKQETPRIKTLKLKIDSSFTFEPGQFVIVSIPGFMINDFEVRRSYSISSSPLQKEIIEMAVSINNEGKFSPRIHALKKGDTLKIEGPFGRFFLKSYSEGDVFIAGGAGIAPIMSMLRKVYSEGDAKLKLYYGIRTAQDLLYEKELKEMAKKGLELTVVASQDESWTGKKGYVSDYFLEPDIRKHAYVCGPPQMASTVIEKLKELGFKEENIHREQW